MDKLTCLLLLALQSLSIFINFNAFAFPLGPKGICPVDANGLYYGAFPEDLGCCVGNCTSSDFYQSLEESSFLELQNQLQQLLLLSNVSEDDEYYVEEQSHGRRVHRNRRSTLETFEEDQHTNIQVEKDPQDLSAYVPMCLTSSKYVAPLYATSTTRHKPVQLVQIPKVMEQHIEMKFCQEGASPIYKGFCKQAYKHEKVYIVNPEKVASSSVNQGYSSGPQVYFSQDTIYVASGCKALIDTHEVMDQAKKVQEYVKQYQQQYGGSSSGEKKTSGDYFRFVSPESGSGRPSASGRSLDSGEVGHGRHGHHHRMKSVRPPFGAGHRSGGHGKAHHGESNEVFTEQSNATTTALAVLQPQENLGVKARSADGEEIFIATSTTITPDLLELEEPTSTTVQPDGAEQVEERFGLVDDIMVQLDDVLAVDGGEVFDEFSSGLEESFAGSSDDLDVETTTISSQDEESTVSSDIVVQLDDFSGTVESGQVFDESSGAQESFVEVENGSEIDEMLNSTDTAEGFKAESHQDGLQVQDLALETTTQVSFVAEEEAEEEAEPATTNSSTTEASKISSQQEFDPAVLDQEEEHGKRTSSEVNDADESSANLEGLNPVASNETSEVVPATGHTEEKRETVIAGPVLKPSEPSNSTALAVHGPSGPRDRLQNRHPMAPAHHMGHHPGPFGQRSRIGRFPGRLHPAGRFLAGGAGHIGPQQPRFPAGTPVIGEQHPHSSRLTHQPAEEDVQAFPEHDRGTRNTGDVKPSSPYYEPETSSTRRRVPPKPLEIGVPVFASKEYGNPLQPKLRTSRE